MLKSTKENFYKSVIKKGEPLIIKDIEISEELVIQADIIATGLILENCIFKEPVSFENIDLNCGIKFNNCKFEKSLSINACRSKNYDSKFNFNTYHIEFKKTEIQNLYFIGQNVIERGIRIYEKSKITRLRVESLHSSMGSFSINDSLIEKQLDFSNVNLNQDLSIRGNSIVNSMIRFENVFSQSISLTESTFNDNFHIWAGRIKNLTLNDGIFKEDFSITAVPILNMTTIIGTEFKKSIIFKLQDNTNNKTGLLNEIYLKAGKFNERFIVNGNNETIKELTINCSQQLSGDIYFNSCSISKTIISGDNYNANIVFNHCKFNNFSFENFYNYSTLSIISAKSDGENSELSIQNSSLGTSNFFNTLFNSFNKINIYNSVLTDIVTVNVKWFDDDNLNIKEKEIPSDYTQKKEIYRQIKFVLERQGDKISSLKFKSLEMKAYKNELFSGVNKYLRIFNGNRFTLWVGQTNNFGQSWTKPALLATAFGVFFQLLIIIGISDKLHFKFNLSKESFNITVKEYCNYFNTLPQLMNPVHYLTRIFPNIENISFTVYFLDYFLKIILAFFIFQIISAFRKYMK